jgi:hypothetical protein
MGSWGRSNISGVLNDFIKRIRTNNIAIHLWEKKKALRGVDAADGV